MSRFTDKSVEEQIDLLLNDEHKLIKSWNAGLGIKFLMILPILFFFVGFLLLNPPENFLNLLTILIYPILLIILGVILLFFMLR